MNEPVVLSQDRLLQLAEPFGNLVNSMQVERGENISDVITAGLYAMGVVLAHMRVEIQGGDTVSISLLPLWRGYTDFINVPVVVIPRTIQ